MHVFNIRSGIVDAVVEGVLIAVSVLLVAPTLERIRGLSLETKLRRGEVVDLQRRSLTISETTASIVVIIGLPIAALLTSLGRNGDSAPVYKTERGTIDVWDPTASGPNFEYGQAAASVLLCGTIASGSSPQAATVRGGDLSLCPGSFRNTSAGFVRAEQTRLETPPKSLYPSTDVLKVEGDWHTQCAGGEDARNCFTWMWTTKEISVCPSHDKQSSPAACGMYNLMPGAPAIDHSKAVGKIQRATADGGGIEILIAHFMVTTLETTDIEIIDEQRQVTIVETWSAVGLLLVVGFAVGAALATWLGTQWTSKKRGFDLRLHTYSGLAAYVASLEERYNVSTDGSRSTGARPLIRLTEGAGPYAGHVAIGHDPSAKGYAVKTGKIGIGRVGVDDFPEGFDGAPV